MSVLLGLAAGTLISEDLACIAAGTLIAAGHLGFFEGAAACSLGIFLGDIGLFLAGRFLGRSYVEKKVPAGLRAKAEELLRRRGAWAVFASRFSPGLRLPVYLAAGVTSRSMWRFCVLFFLASAVWTPLLVGATAWVGEQAVRRALAASGTVSLWTLCAGASVLLLRRGRLRKYLRWEFWPSWAAYLPLVPALAWLAVRYGGLRVCLLANPGIPLSGLAGESKREILTALAPSGAVAEFTDAVGAASVELPCVVKPDVGERGRGVRIVRTCGELAEALAAAGADAIVQEYVGGEEFGVYYARMPWEARGRVLSLTHKRFPVVVGDGRSTVAELIVADARARLIADVYVAGLRVGASVVPAKGAEVLLTELGSHCRGSIFVDARRLVTEELEREVDRIARCAAGFHLGRFDMRVASIEDLQAGRGLRVLEFNGLTAEPAHIYDPAVTVWSGYAALYEHYRMAFASGAHFRELGGALPAWRGVWRVLGDWTAAGRPPRSGGRGGAGSLVDASGTRGA